MITFGQQSTPPRLAQPDGAPWEARPGLPGGVAECKGGGGGTTSQATTSIVDSYNRTSSVYKKKSIKNSGNTTINNITKTISDTGNVSGNSGVKNLPDVVKQAAKSHAGNKAGKGGLPSGKRLPLILGAAALLFFLFFMKRR